MKHWTLPARYKTLEKLFTFPLMFSKREESLRIMENSRHVRDMIDLLNLLPQTVADLPLGVTWDEKEQEKKLRTSYISSALRVVSMRQSATSSSKGSVTIWVSILRAHTSRTIQCPLLLLKRMRKTSQ